ncbi:MAG: ATP-binding protein [Gammaproteobacteria bacterium]|nr:ATP-binding protein [Gammaproteobacteria bacterium]
MDKPTHFTPDREQLIISSDRSLSLRVLPGTLIYVVLFTINVYANAYYLERPILVYTAGTLLVLIGLFRLALYVWFERLHAWNRRLWRLMFFFGTLGVAAAWSLTWSIAIVQDGLVTTTNLSIMMTIGITGAGVATLAPDKQLVIYYLVLMFLPTPMAVYISGATEALTISLMFLIGIPFLLSVGLRLNRDYWQGLNNMALLDHRAKELAAAHDAAVAADRAKSEFLAKMSHEIRTPMNGVLGMTELLMNTQLNKRQRHLTNSILGSGHLLLDVINDVLDFSKINAGKLELENTPFDLRETIEQQIEMFAEPAHRKGIELISSLSVNFPSEVTGDPLRLRQVLANLMSNALKFTEQGEIIIRVHPTVSSEKQQEYRFEVEDTGIGVERSAQTHIFDSFTQADGSTTRRFGGSGLGLAIAKQLVELLGGEIGLDNPPEGGAIFWFTASFTLQQHGVETTPQKRIISRYRRVLLLMTNAKSRSVIESMLTQQGLEIDIATCGIEVKEILKNASQTPHAYVAAIVDAGLSDMQLSEWIHLLHAEESVIGMDKLILTKINTELNDSWLQDDHSVLKTKPLRLQTLLRFLEQGPAGFKSYETDKLQDPQAIEANRLPVLLVEDNLINQEIASSMLEILGFRVVIANNGQEALDLFENQKFTLALMDCQMPIMDGYQATRIIRVKEQEAKTEHLPIIAMTANALQGDRETALSAGMDDYLAKPFNKDQLSTILHNWTAG